MVDAYITKLGNFLSVYFEQQTITYIEITKYFCEHLKDKINNFRTVNNMALKEIFKGENKKTSINTSSNVFDKSSNEILQYNDIKAFTAEITKKYGDKIVNIKNLICPSTENVKTDVKIVQKETSSSYQIKSKIEENIETHNNPSLDSYLNLCEYISKIKNNLNYTRTNNFFLIALLNKDWLEKISDDKVKLLTANIYFKDLDDKTYVFRKLEEFSIMHHNLHLFLKILFRKYQCEINE